MTASTIYIAKANLRLMYNISLSFWHISCVMSKRKVKFNLKINNYETLSTNTTYCYGSICNGYIGNSANNIR